MKHFSNNCIPLISFDQIYIQSIRPKLEAIDIFLKTNTTPYDINDVADLFVLEPSSILTAMEDLNITTLDKINFFSLIFHLPSDICHLIKRQWQYSSYQAYTPEIIAYIYKLNIHKVRSAFEELDVDLITEDQLSSVFKRIHMTVFNGC